MQIINGNQRPSAAETLNNISEIQAILVRDQNFGQAVRLVRALMDDMPNAQFRGQLEELENDYQLMCNFLLKGYKDSQRPILYKSLVRRLSTLLGNMETNVKRVDDSYFLSLASTVRSSELDITSIGQHLVKHVQDVAMLSLDDDSVKESHSNVLFDTHFSYMRKLFNAIIVSYQWTSEQAQDMANLLASPTIDVVDAQTLVSAISLATLNTPDPQKVIALVQTYVKAEDELIRQRALVGWVFAMGQADYRLFPEVELSIGNLLDGESVRKEILQLEKQIVLCQNATQDQETLRKDILPSIMKNQDFEMTRFGIKEKEEDPMVNILHPDAEDQKVEMLERSFQRISDMQKHGADIYFGGFSQMKRFSFFYTLCNWFTPFYMEHPQLRHLSPQLRESNFMRTLMCKGPFCDSDKYSFALGMSSVFANLPENIKSMMDRGELQGGLAEDEGPIRSQAFVRRSYLQDLFRFFKLCDDRNKFANPFDDSKIKRFWEVPTSRNKMLVEIRNLEVFLLKQKKYQALKNLLATHFDQENSEDLRIQALLAYHYKKYDKAEQSYQRIIMRNPNDEQALGGLAQACFHQGKFADAERHYEALLNLLPDNKSYALYLAISQINCGKLEKAAKLLFKLNYNDPDNLNVKRALAWTELWMKNLQHAHKLYNDILSDASHEMADLLNAGYCCFFEGQLEKSIRLIANGLEKQLKKKSKKDCVYEQIRLDKKMFDMYGIPDVDRIILCDLVHQYSISNPDKPEVL